MAYNKSALEYKKNAVNGASPLQLIVMLYDGALRFMEAGKHHMKERNLEKQNDSLQKAQRIVLELMASLDMEKGGEIAKNLFSLYGYVTNELITANINDDPVPIDRSIKVLSDLRESWVALESSQHLDGPAEAQLAA
ncbi:MAG: flagellar export chaperone FliS [Fimbriimonadaceae bacterium]|nr:flagellar export chaperone FliS [Fimbriimonadaceae bacterium]